MRLHAGYCMDAMAPALTDATTEVCRLKLSPTPPSSGALSQTSEFGNPIRKRLNGSCPCKKGGQLESCLGEAEAGEALNGKHRVTKGKLQEELLNDSLDLLSQIMKPEHQSALKQKNGVAKQQRTISKLEPDHHCGDKLVNGKRTNVGDQESRDAVSLEAEAASTRGSRLYDPGHFSCDDRVSSADGERVCKSPSSVQETETKSGVGTSLPASAGKRPDCSRVEEVPGDISATDRLVQESRTNLQHLEVVGSRPIPHNCASTESSMAARVLQSEQKLTALKERAKMLSQRLRLVQVGQLESHLKQQLHGLMGSSIHRLPPLSGGVQSALLDLPHRYSGASTPLHARSYVYAEDPWEPTPDLQSIPGCAEELSHMSRRLQANVRHVERDVDSDATESSSGGETDVEDDMSVEYYMEGRRSSRQQSATWRWAEERASIASRWTWLQAQVSDLEYKIRQHNELYRQLRNNKGAVQLQIPQSPDELLKHQHLSAHLGSVEKGFRPPKSTPCSPSLLLSNVNKQSSRFTHTVGGLMTPCSSSSPTSPGHSRPTTPQRPANGLSNCPQCGANDCSSCAESSDMEDGVPIGNIEQPSASFHDTTCVAARTRPVRDVRHRRILRDSQVCQATRKAQRPVTTRCTCHWPTSCIVCCTGNVSRITLDPDAMSLHERVGLLGPSFHPVLSLSHEIPLHIHLEALLRKAEVQHRGLHRTKGLAARKLLGKQWPVQVGSPFDRKLRHKLDLGISSTKCSWSKVALDKEQALCLDSPRQGASPLLFSEAEEEGIMHMRKRRRSGHLHLGAGKRRSGKSHPLCLNEAVESSSGTLGRQLHSPALTDVLSSTSVLHGSQAVSVSSTSTSSIQSSQRKRRGESSFDINNIVIPLSMATTARVEKIQYKEILTPSWKLVDIKAKPEEDGVDDEVEDLSDEAFGARHAKYEQKEQARWNFWYPSIHRRTRSFHKSLSDGRYTPQPPSPDVGLEQTLAASPGASEAGLSLRLQDRGLRDSLCESTRSSTPDMSFEELIVQPWERRSFPLRDDELKALESVSPPLQVYTPVLPLDADAIELLPSHLPLSVDKSVSEMPVQQHTDASTVGDVERPIKRSLRSASNKMQAEQSTDAEQTNASMQRRSSEPAQNTRASHTPNVNLRSGATGPPSRTRASTRARHSIAVRVSRRTVSH
uniref:KAT8 regulatory NSL complex subunit 1-like isoform X2 n=1 Tax=Myxine glutinosa TaxID=7769 RepID=UPI00358F8C8F